MTHDRPRCTTIAIGGRNPQAAHDRIGYPLIYSGKGLGKRHESENSGSLGLRAFGDLSLPGKTLPPSPLLLKRRQRHPKSPGWP